MGQQEKHDGTLVCSPPPPPPNIRSLFYSVLFSSIALSFPQLSNWQGIVFPGISPLLPRAKFSALISLMSLFKTNLAS